MNEEVLKNILDAINAMGNILGRQENILYSLPDMQKVNLLFINRDKVQYDMECYRDAGVQLSDREIKITVSLTSFPDRMYDLKYTLFSLAKQSLRPDRIVLWLSDEEFPRHEEDIGLNLLRYIDRWKITLRWCKNIGSYKKLIYALQEYPNDIIVTADDDIWYRSNWLETLYESYRECPEKYIICHRAHYVRGGLAYKQWYGRPLDAVQISYRNFPVGAGGILYYPGCLHADVLYEEKFLQLAPGTDDIWFWAMAVRNSTKIRYIDSENSQLIYTNPDREIGVNGDCRLGKKNIEGNRNDQNIQRIWETYPEIQKQLSEESELETTEIKA